jgi:hypothetical protein
LLFLCFRWRAIFARRGAYIRLIAHMFVEMGLLSLGAWQDVFFRMRKPLAFIRGAVVLMNVGDVASIRGAFIVNAVGVRFPFLFVLSSERTLDFILCSHPESSYVGHMFRIDEN